MIIVVGLAFEARIAAGPGMRVVCGGDSRHLSATLAAAIAEARTLFGNCPGIISFGVAGGLAPQLRPGTCVIGSAILSGSNRMPTNHIWSQQLLQTLPGAVSGVLLGVSAPICDPLDKRALHVLREQGLRGTFDRLVVFGALHRQVPPCGAKPPRR